MSKYDAINAGIKTRDIKALREAMGNICYADPAFQTTDFQDILTEIRRANIDILDKELQGEIPRIPLAKVTQADFTKAIFQLKKNFCEQRIIEVRRIGREITPKQKSQTDTKAATNVSKEQPLNHDDYGNLRSLEDVFNENIRNNDRKGLQKLMMQVIKNDPQGTGEDVYNKLQLLEHNRINIFDELTGSLLISTKATNFTDADYYQALNNLERNFNLARVNEAILIAGRVNSFENKVRSVFKNIVDHNQ